MPVPNQPSRPSNRIRPLLAWRALRALMDDPDDTAKVFDIIDALSGKSGARLFKRFCATELGRRVLCEERDIVRTLSDRETLEALPEASLGRSYAAFMAQEQLSADGLVSASEEGGDGPDGDPDLQRFGDRIRDTHDLWHVVTGYNRDLIGEASLLAFTVAQTRNPGIAAVVAMAYLRFGGEEHARPMIRAAFRRGRRAGWLLAADWEALLERPLAEVRVELGVGDPPAYTEVRSDAGEAALAAS